MYRVKDGEIIERALPRTGVLSDGRSVSGYHLLPVATLKDEGWLPVVDDKPDYDPASEQLIRAEKIEKDRVVINYTIEPLPEPEPEPPSELEVLRKALIDKAVITAKDLTDTETSLKDVRK